MVALAHVVFDDRADVVDNDASLVRDVCSRENRGATGHDHHDGLVVVAGGNLDVGKICQAERNAKFI